MILKVCITSMYTNNIVGFFSVLIYIDALQGRSALTLRGVNGIASYAKVTARREHFLNFALL